MGQPSSKYIVVGIRVIATEDPIFIASSGFDSETQAEHAAIELAEAHNAVEYRVYTLQSRWKTQTRVERVTETGEDLAPAIS